MYQNISTNEAIAQLMGDEYANWSWNGAEALVKYLEELEDDIGKPIVLDTVAIRCDYSGYESSLEAAKHYDFIPFDDEDEDDLEAEALKYLEDRTTVIQFEGGIIIQQF